MLGLNYYQPDLVGRGRTGQHRLTVPRPPGTSACHPVSGPVTGMGWAVDPTGLRDLLIRVHPDYAAGYGGLPLMVTENGAAFPDQPAADGRVHDEARIAYLRAHFTAAHEALTAGVDLRGYFVWSLLDNFEWAFGYSQRFGLIHVDYPTLTRTVKDSARWYRQVIAAGRLTHQ